MLEIAIEEFTTPHIPIILFAVEYSPRDSPLQFLS